MSESIGARIRSPTSGCERMTAHCSSVSGPALLSRIDSGTRILPMSCSSAPSSTLAELVRRQAQHGGDLDRELGHLLVWSLVSPSFASSAFESAASVSR